MLFRLTLGLIIGANKSRQDRKCRGHKDRERRHGHSGTPPPSKSHSPKRAKTASFLQINLSTKRQEQEVMMIKKERKEKATEVIQGIIEIERRSVFSMRRSQGLFPLKI